MLDILPLGPFETDRGSFFTAAALNHGTPCVAEGRTVVAAVRTLLERMPHPRDTELSLPPWVAKDAKLLGAKTRPPPNELVMLGVMALFGMQSSLPSGQLGGHALSVIQAVFDFIRAEPWTWLHGDDPLEIEIGGRRHVVSVLGMGGETYGLAVYRGRAAPGGVPAESSFGVFLEKEPVLAAKALQVLEVDWVPIFFSVTKRASGKMTAAEAEVLIAALATTTRMAREQTTHAQVKIEGLRGPIEARVQAMAEHADDEPRPSAKVGRNDPCPCGSGRKYKKCCLDKETRVRPASEHDLDRDLLIQVEALTDATWPGFLADKLGACPLAGDAGAMNQLGRTWVLCHAVTPDGRTPLRAFLDVRREQLSPQMRAWAEAQSRAHLSLLEVLAVEGDGHVRLRDLLTREEHRVHDVGVSQSAVPGLAAIGRVVTTPSKALLAGTLPRVLRPTEAEPVRAAIERRLKKAGISRTPTGLHAAAAGRIVLEVALEQLAKAERVASRPTEMVGGSAIEQVSDVFDVADVARARQQLDAHPDVRQEAPGKWFVVGAPIETTVFREREGTLALKGTRLSVDTFSRAPADRLRRKIEDALGATVTHRARTHADLGLESRGDLRVQAMVADEVPSMEFVRREQDRLWLGQPLPALAGRTPREAMADAKGRKQLALLLKERATMDAMHAAMPPGLDVPAVLGLGDAGKLMSEAARHPRLPKLSEALLDWFGVISPWTSEDARTPASTARFERQTSVAVRLWNATLSGVPLEAQEAVVEALAAEGPWDRATLERLRGRRLRLFVEDQRKVESHEVRWNGGEPGLVVAFSAPRRRGR